MPLNTHKTGINHPIIHHPSATVYLIINLLCIGDGLFLGFPHYDRSKGTAQGKVDLLVGFSTDWIIVSRYWNLEALRSFQTKLWSNTKADNICSLPNRLSLNETQVEVLWWYTDTRELKPKWRHFDDQWYTWSVQLAPKQIWRQAMMMVAAGFQVLFYIL